MRKNFSKHCIRRTGRLYDVSLGTRSLAGTWSVFSQDRQGPVLDTVKACSCWLVLLCLLCKLWVQQLLPSSAQYSGKSGGTTEGRRVSTARCRRQPTRAKGSPPRPLWKPDSATNPHHKPGWICLCMLAAYSLPAIKSNKSRNQERGRRVHTAGPTKEEMGSGSSYTSSDNSRNRNRGVSSVRPKPCWEQVCNWGWILHFLLSLFVFLPFFAALFYSTRFFNLPSETH